MKHRLVLFLIINVQHVVCGGVFSSLCARTGQNGLHDQEDDSILSSSKKHDRKTEWETPDGVRHKVGYLCTADNTLDTVKFKIGYSSTFNGRPTGQDYALEWEDEEADFENQRSALVRKSAQVANLRELMILRHLLSRVFN